MLFLVTLSGEIPIKSNVSRNRMLRFLTKNMKDALMRSGLSNFKFRIVNAKLLVEISSDALELLSRVFGVHKVSAVSKFTFRSLDELVSEIVPHCIGIIKNKRFAVRVKRSGVHDFTSLDVAREIGARLKPFSAGVDLENPEVEVKIEIHGNEAYLIERELRGPGGLPQGSEGSALVLFSGGFDSPVAAWLVAKRGVYVDFLHLHMGSASSTYNAFKVAKSLVEKWFFGYRPRFILVDFTDLARSIVSEVDARQRQVVLRALMYIVAEKIASKLGYKVVVTGESIGQASSQTLRNLVAIDKSVAPKTLILRPLIGFDKEEIISLSRKLGLYELSSKVEEVCVLSKRGVATSSKPHLITDYVNKLIPNLVKAIDSMKVFELLETDQSSILDSVVEIDFIPENSILIDVREREKYVSNGLPGAIHVGDVDSKTKEKLMDKNLVFYCDSGYLSSMIAKEFRKLGFKAFSISVAKARKCLSGNVSPS